MKQLKYIKFIILFFVLFLLCYSEIEAAAGCGEIPIARGSNFPPIGQVRENRCIQWVDDPPPVRCESGYNYNSPEEAQNSCISYRTELVDKEMVSYTTGPCNFSNAQATCNWSYDSPGTYYNCDNDPATSCRTDLGCSVVQTSAGYDGYCATYGGSSSTCSGKSYYNCSGQCHWVPGKDPEYACTGGKVRVYHCPDEVTKGAKEYTANPRKCSGKSEFAMAGTSTEIREKQAEKGIIPSVERDQALAKKYCESFGEDVCPDFGSLKAECTTKYQAYTISMPRVCVQFSNLNPISDITAEQYYTSGGAPAYCLHAERLRPYSTTWNYEFDVTQCESSMQSKDCGYANILVEAAYRGYDSNYGLVDIALRLWAADSNLGRDGTFERVGLPTSEANPAVSFGEGSKNLYTTTIANLWRYIRPGKTLASVEGPEDLQTVNCYSLGPDYPYSEGNGIACGYDGGYLNSIYLYINTLQNNKKIKEHLDEALKKKGINTVAQYKPESVKVTKSADNPKFNDPDFGELEGEIVDDKIEITYVMNKVVEKECDINDPETKIYCKANQILSFDIGGGKTIMVASDMDSRIDEIQKCRNSSSCTLVEPEDGEDLRYYDYCKKNRCYKTVKYTRICNENTTGQQRKSTVKVITDKSTQELSVKPLFACGNQTAYQVMYTFDPSGKITNSHGDYYETHTKTIPPVVKFKCDCDPDTYYSKDGYTTAFNAMGYAKATYTDDRTIYSENYTRKVSGNQFNTFKENNTCGILKNGNVVKSGTDTYGYGPYDLVQRASVNDISMAKVLNMCYDGDKLQFDYSDDFKVNQDICKIYCRDETNYYLGGKTRVRAGMSFDYDIATKLNEAEVTMQLVEKQEYNTTTKKQTSKYILEPVNVTYRGFGNDREKLYTTIVVTERECTSEIFYNHDNEKGHNWQYYYDNVLGSDASVKEAQRQQLVYDLQNCNFLSKSQSVNANPAFEKTGQSTIDYIKSSYGCNNKGECKCNSQGKGGALCSTMTFTWSENDILNLGSIDIDYDMKSTISEPTYCGVGCYKIVQESQSGNIKLMKDQVGSQTTNVGNRNRPTNDYATIKIKTEYDFYNTNVYYATAVSGVISQTKPANNRTSVTELPKYSYPTSYKSASGTESTASTFSIGAYERYYKKRDIYNKLVDKALSNYTCSYDRDNDTTIVPIEDDDKCYEGGIYVPKMPDCPPKLGYSFKNVDAGNLFPTDKAQGDSLSSWKSIYALNWDDADGRAAQAEIEASADTLVTTDEYLEYRFTLSKAQINELKKYNKEKQGYQTSIELYGCEDPDSNDGVFLNCKSRFLQEDILKNSNSRYATVDSRYDTGISKHNSQ